jgi:hypothetical protein
MMNGGSEDSFSMRSASKALFSPDIISSSTALKEIFSKKLRTDTRSYVGIHSFSACSIRSAVSLSLETLTSSMRIEQPTFMTSEKF